MINVNDLTVKESCVYLNHITANKAVLK